MTNLLEQYNTSKEALYSQLCKQFCNLADQESVDMAFLWVCCNGCTIMANLLLDKHPDVQVNDSIFHMLCEYGNIEMLDLLFDTFPHTHVDMHTMMILACRNDHLHTLQWLIDRYPQVDIHANNEAILFHACSSQYLPIAEWILQNYDSFDIGALQNRIFRKACSYQSMTKMLLTRFPDIDVYDCDFESIVTSSENSWPSMMMLVEHTKNMDISYHVFNKIIKYDATMYEPIVYILSKHTIKSKRFVQSCVDDMYIYILPKYHDAYADLIVAHTRAKLLSQTLTSRCKSAKN